LPQAPESCNYNNCFPSCITCHRLDQKAAAYWRGTGDAGSCSSGPHGMLGTTQTGSQDYRRKVLLGARKDDEGRKAVECLQGTGDDGSSGTPHGMLKPVKCWL